MLLQLVLKSAEGFAPAPDGDAALLRRFIAEQDESAFAALLQRHGPMVWSACRHLLADDADAEDAFQATFLVLVRSAKSVRNAAAIGAWLHGTAVRIATRTKRSAARRRLREERAAEPEADRTVPETTWNELLAAVHEEVQNLPENLRTAFVLCELEGVRQSEAAARLGWKPGTLTGRLTRARQRIVQRLADRGLAPALGGVALGLATASAAVPIPMIDTTMTLICAGGSVPPAILNLVKEATPMMTMRSKLAAAVLLFAGGLGAVLFPMANAQQPMGGKTGFAPQPGPGGGPGIGPGGGPGTGSSGPPRADSGIAPSAAMGASRSQQWEYKFVPAEKNVREQFTELGNEGWEYCGPLPPPSGSMVFKRPKPPAPRGGGMGGGPGFPGVGPGGVPGLPGPGFGAPGGGGGVPAPMPGSPPGGGGGLPGAGVGALTPKAPNNPLVLISLRNAAAADLGATLESIFQNKLKVVAEPRTNSVILSGEEKFVDEAKALIEKLDVGVPVPPKAKP
jgi:RNA polymerase sigma factor (sigma-70 family)